MSPKLCPKCYQPVKDPPTGRPRVYCSDACKRAAGYEATRLSRRLARFEDEMADLRLGRGLCLWKNKREKAAEMEKLESELSRAEERLRLILGGLAEDE